MAGSETLRIGTMKIRGIKRKLGAILASTLAGTIGIGALALAAGMPPAPGVYACYEARPAMNVPGCVRSSLGCMGIVVTPAPTMMFGLIDGTTYTDYDGKRGHYTYDAQSGILTMTDGSREGWKYKHTEDWAFRALDAKGEQTAYNCPLDDKKDPLKRPW
jgi:hypothetical protein